MLQKPSFVFPTAPEEYAPEPAPTMEEWHQLWTAWTNVTLGMIPKDQLLSKPIDLRNPCIFYLGHIPTFLDSLIARATGEEPTQPRHYQSIFQRGIDPDVEDPSQCHPHSETPASWPELNGILDYQSKVRARAEELYKDGSAAHQPMVVQRVLWLGFEHEAMHLETLLYMLVQSNATLPPPDVITPDFVSGRTWERRLDAPKGNAWVKIPETTLDIGMNDPEEPEDSEPRFFGWDNEKPVQKNVKVASFRARAFPITNEEYAKYLTAKSSDTIPVSWTRDGSGTGETNGVSNLMETAHIKSFFGPIPLKLALDWPVMASYDELEGCARWMDARIPTAEEVRAIYQYAELDAAKGLEKKRSKMFDAVNGCAGFCPW